MGKKLDKRVNTMLIQCGVGLFVDPSLKSCFTIKNFWKFLIA